MAPNFLFSFDLNKGTLMVRVIDRASGTRYQIREHVPPPSMERAHFQRDTQPGANRRDICVHVYKYAKHSLVSKQTEKDGKQTFCVFQCNDHAITRYRNILHDSPQQNIFKK